MKQLRFLSSSQNLCLAATISLCSTTAFAQSDIYVCVDQDGHKSYQNVQVNKSCKALDLLPGNTSLPYGKGAAKSSKSGVKTSSVSTPTPSGYPKIEGSVQKERDTDRKKILEDELKAEEKKLAELKKDYNNGEPERHGDEKNAVKYQARIAVMKDDISRHEANIQMLKKSIGN